MHCGNVVGAAALYLHGTTIKDIPKWVVPHNKCLLQIIQIYMQITFETCSLLFYFVFNSCVRAKAAEANLSVFSCFNQEYD